MAEFKHKVSVVVEGQQIDGWLSYEIASSMIDPADAFTLTRPFDPKAWLALRRDARIRVLIDGIVILDGIIDKRTKRTKDGTMTVTGRDRAGRLVQESAESIDYDSLTLTEAIRRLVAPWFTTVTLSDARNRALRRGKGKRVSAGSEPIVANERHYRTGRVHPGQTKWQAIEQIMQSSLLCAWSSADGREFFIGQPNQTQAAQYQIINARVGSSRTSTCKDLVIDEDNGDRFSKISCVGTGGGDEDDYGDNVVSREASVFDNPFNKIDGTGRDFIHPKRMLMPERQFDANQDAAAVARREQLQRDFHRTKVMATMQYHGQFLTGTPTIFAPNTMAHVIDEDFEPALDDDYLIFACTYTGSRKDGEWTNLEMVPRGTEVIL